MLCSRLENLGFIYITTTKESVPPHDDLSILAKNWDARNDGPQTETPLICTARLLTPQSFASTGE